MKIETKLDKAEYRPGTRAKLSIAVTDESGQPIPGAVSLSAVDEAVFSVLPQTAGIAPLMSSTEQNLLKPVYAIYPWSPTAKSNLPADEQNRFEQALFARAGQQKSGRDAILQQAIRQFGENDQYLLDVLRRPDWERIAESMPYLQKFMPLLRGNGADYTLNDSSYREHERTSEMVRNQRSEQMAFIWVIVGVVVGLAAFVWFLTLMANSFLQIFAILLLLGFLASLMLPAVQSAREAAYRNTAAGNLKQIGLALENRENSFSEMSSGLEPAAGESCKLAFANGFRKRCSGGRRL